MIDKDHQIAGHARNVKARQYRRLYNACFVVFLVIVMFERLLPAQWRFRKTMQQKSLVEEAKEQAGMFVPYLFMNY